MHGRAKAEAIMGATPEQKNIMVQWHQNDSDDGDRVDAKTNRVGGTQVMEGCASRRLQPASTH